MFSPHFYSQFTTSTDRLKPDQVHINLPVWRNCAAINRPRVYARSIAQCPYPVSIMEINGLGPKIWYSIFNIFIFFLKGLASYIPSRISSSPAQHEGLPPRWQKVHSSAINHDVMETYPCWNLIRESVENFAYYNLLCVTICLWRIEGLVFYWSFPTVHHHRFKFSTRLIFCVHVLWDWIAL